MQDGRLMLENCIVKECEGPALDVSQRATTTVKECQLTGNGGVTYLPLKPSDFSLFSVP